MGDRTSLQVYVYDCPEDERGAALEVLAEEFSLDVEWGTQGGSEELRLDVPYTAHEISCGSAAEVNDRLIGCAPGCSFVLWEDPAMDWLGDVYAYTPQLGHFTAECTADGQPVYTASQITSMVDGVTPGTDLVEHVAKQTGGPWFGDWQEHRTESAAA